MTDFAALWERFDALEPARFLAEMQALAARHGPDDAVAAYELGGAHDSIGEEAAAAEHYERAFALGLPDELRRPATIQYASTLRNLGRVEEGLALLEAERDRTSDELDDAVAAFIALALADCGRAREATGLALAALARHLPRYQRSVANYAAELA
jgi:tetratricopeptide (TPR) repeat protein